MPTGPRVLMDNVCYHIITRGNQKQRIFRENSDYGECLDRLRKYKKRYNFSLYAYCLMPNHIHLLGEIQITYELAPLMSSLLRSYTAYFNNKYDKVGHLWQGRFKSKVILKDRYLIDCINYIEANPVRTDISSTLDEYSWSSYKERALGRPTELPLLNGLPL